MSALKKLELELKNSKPGSKGEADRLSKKNQINKTIQGNKKTSEAVGTGSNELADDKLKKK